MQTRREFLALSAGLLALLPGCTADEPEGEVDPGAQTQPVQMRLAIPASYLSFTGNTAGEAAQDYADYSDGGIGTSVLEDGSLELYVTDHWYGRLRAMWEDELDKNLDTLDAVASVEVTDARDGVTVTASPSFADHADTDLYQLVAACGFLQLLDGREGWGVTVSLVDDGTGVEVARATLPGEELAIGREAWEDAVGAAGA